MKLTRIILTVALAAQFSHALVPASYLSSASRSPWKRNDVVAQLDTISPAALNLPLLSLSTRQADSDDGPYSAAGEDRPGGYRTTYSTASSRSRFRIAHGVLMAFSFTILFPLGAVLMHTTHLVWVHAAVQSFAYLNAIAGLGLGIWLGRNVRYLDYAHTVIGMAVLAALLIQVSLGIVSHRNYVSRKRLGNESEIPKAKRRFLTWGFFHRWFGRFLIALGMINGGLGLRLAGNTTGGEIAYGVVAGISGTSYIILILLQAWKDYGRRI